MDDLWFALITIILIKPVVDGGPEKIGDVIQSSLLGASITQEDCETATAAAVSIFTAAGQGSVLVVSDCIKLPAKVGTAQGMEPT